MNGLPFDHDDRQLEQEMIEAADHVSRVAHVEKDPLLIILWRLNSQDKTLKSISNELGEVTRKLDEHVLGWDSVKESVDEIVTTWRGTKIAGRAFGWVIGIFSAVGATITEIRHHNGQ